jgi:prepilin peptidase CpaA
MQMMLITDLVTITAASLAAMIDLRSRKIPNWLTLTVAAAGMFGGFLFYAIQGDWTGGWQWLLFSGKGWLVGIGIFLIPFILGGMGGGDVKLLGAIGALKGASFAIETALMGALWGGLLAILAILIKKRPEVLRKFGYGLKIFAITGGQAGKEFMLPDDNTSEKEKIYVPYGVAIFLGVLTVYLVGMKLPI